MYTMKNYILYCTFLSIFFFFSPVVSAQESVKPDIQFTIDYLIKHIPENSHGFETDIVYSDNNDYTFVNGEYAFEINSEYSSQPNEPSSDYFKIADDGSVLFTVNARASTIRTYWERYRINPYDSKVTDHKGKYNFRTNYTYTFNIRNVTLSQMDLNPDPLLAFEGFRLVDLKLSGILFECSRCIYRKGSSNKVFICNSGDRKTIKSEALNTIQTSKFFLRIPDPEMRGRIYNAFIRYQEIFAELDAADPFKN